MSDPKPTQIAKLFTPGNNTTIGCFGGVVTVATFDFNNKSGSNQPHRAMVTSEFMDVLHGLLCKLPTSDTKEATVVSSRRIPEDNTWIPNLIVTVRKGTGDSPYQISFSYPEVQFSVDYDFDLGKTVSITAPQLTISQQNELLFKAFVDKIRPGSVLDAMNASVGRILTKEEKAARTAKKPSTATATPAPAPADIPY